jgi:hypothetical protein
MREQRPRRVGWLIVALGVVALGVLGAYLVSSSLVIDPNDPGWAEVAWIVSPMLASGASLAIGILLMLVAAFRLIDVALSRAAKATGLGCIGAPVLYLISLLVLADFLDSLDADALWLLPLLIFALPIVMGIATVLGVVMHRPAEVDVDDLKADRGQDRLE